MNKKTRWSMNFNTATLVLIPMAVGINFIGKYIASFLRLPLWLDSIGTILAAFLGGPIVGALSGAINNVIYGFTDPIAFIYAISSIGIGLAAGIMASIYAKKGFQFALLTALVCAFVAIVISTPLNIFVWGGQTGNAVGDAVFAWARFHNYPLPLASLLDEIVIDIPDKIITVFIVLAIYRAIPKNILLLFKNDEQIESLD